MYKYLGSDCRKYKVERRKVRQRRYSEGAYDIGVKKFSMLPFSVARIVDNRCRDLLFSDRLAERMKLGGTMKYRVGHINPHNYFHAVQAWISQGIREALV